MPAARAWSLTDVPTAVLVSGTGTNLRAVIASVRGGDLPLDLRLVIANKAHAPALRHAREAGIPTQVFGFDRARQDRAQYATAIAEAICTAGVRLVLLLGWMHVLAPQFLAFDFDVLNLHPAYLPEDPAADEVVFEDGSASPVFRGAHALRDAIAAGARQVGASLIRITADVDRGPLLARRAMELLPGEDEAAALQRLHRVEQEVVRAGVRRWIGEQALG